MLFVLLCLIAVVAIGSVAVVACVRSTRARRLELDRLIELKEREREAENLEFFLTRLETLHRQTGFNPTHARQEAKKALDKLRHEQ